MCVTREALVKFYGQLSFSLRTLIHYRVLAATKKPFDYFLVEEPWSVYGVLEKAMGIHNAELFVYMLKHWLEKNGCLKPVEDIRKYLRERGLWQ